MRGSSRLIVVAAASRIFFQPLEVPLKPGFFASQPMPLEPFSTSQRFALTEAPVADLARANLNGGQSYAVPDEIRLRPDGKSNPTVPVPARPDTRMLLVACVLATFCVVHRSEPRPVEKVAMLSFMGKPQSEEKSVIEKFTHLLDEKAFRTAELNRARLCVLFCVGLTIDPLVDCADGLVASLVHQDPESLGKFLSFLAYASWGPVLDRVVSETEKEDPLLQRLAKVQARFERLRIARAEKAERDDQKDCTVCAENGVVEFEFNPLGFQDEDAKVERRIKSIQRQFSRPAKLAMLLYLFELLAANTSVLRESRMAISEVCNVLEHEGDWQVLVEKGGAACVQVIGNVKDIQHDTSSLLNKAKELLEHLMPNDSNVQID